MAIGRRRDRSRLGDPVGHPVGHRRAHHGVLVVAGVVAVGIEPELGATLECLVDPLGVLGDDDRVLLAMDDQDGDVQPVEDAVEGHVGQPLLRRGEIGGLDDAREALLDDGLQLVEARQVVGPGDVDHAREPGGDPADLSAR